MPLSEYEDNIHKKHIFNTPLFSSSLLSRLTADIYFVKNATAPSIHLNVITRLTEERNLWCLVSNTRVPVRVNRKQVRGHVALIPRLHTPTLALH